MLETLRIQNFKSWKDTGTIQFGSLTGFFGTNSSGKTSILQFLLMLKQTVESSDRSRILDLGDEKSYVELGIPSDIIHNHADYGTIGFVLQWQPTAELQDDLVEMNFIKFSYQSSLTLNSQISLGDSGFVLEKFFYSINEDVLAGIENVENDSKELLYRFDGTGEFDEYDENKVFANPTRFYGFPNDLYFKLLHADLLRDMVVDFENQLRKTYYLGPLRELPKRQYTWSGNKVQDVGKRGEYAIAALLATRAEERTLFSSVASGMHMADEFVAGWLTTLHLVESFSVRPLAPGRNQSFEVRVRKTADSPSVLITNVGLGVSNVLPVLVLLAYVPEGSTIILEHPELHLHPAAQADLADVMLDAIKRRNVQIILESHSEHLLHRLQTRIAENKIISADQVKLYFTKFEKEASEMTPLELDTYGNICNWPKNFFGDQFGEAATRMEEELKRRQAAGEK